MLEINSFYMVRIGKKLSKAMKKRVLVGVITSREMVKITTGDTGRNDGCKLTVKGYSKTERKRIQSDDIDCK